MWVISVLSRACGSTVFGDESGEERACDDAGGWGVANTLADWRRACRASRGYANAGRDRRSVDVALDHVVIVIVVVKVIFQNMLFVTPHEHTFFSRGCNIEKFT